MVSITLSERSRRLLASLVREYIVTGEPVSSQVLVRASGLNVSSATVRNALVQLEHEGYLSQPHTSAGRVPTDRGYRVFVDLLLDGRRPVRPPAGVESQLREQVSRPALMEDVLASASHVVSRAARSVGFALAAEQVSYLQRIDFVPLGGSRVLVVVASRGNQVTQKVIDTGEELSPDVLIQAANYITTEFSGLPLVAVRDAVRTRLQRERTLYDELLGRALRLAQTTLDALPKQQPFFVEGAASLLHGVPESDISRETLRALLEMMEEKERLVRLLNEYIDGPGLTVIIGHEHTAPDLRSLSLVASTVVDGDTVRTVGVIGPMRMHYSRAISLVDGTTQVVSRVLRTGD
ncbi:MAG: heat-inducible transcriptional repressor HrcA [Vicinamibacterales bacterium]